MLEFHRSLLIIIRITSPSNSQPFFEKKTGQNKEALEEAGKTATESIENIRTVASLTKEKKMVENYGDQLKGPYSSSLKKAHLTAIAFSFATGILFFAYAAAFWFGAYLIKQDEMDYTGVFK